MTSSCKIQTGVSKVVMEKIFLVATTGFALALVGGCSPAPAAKGTAPVPVLVAKVIATNVPVLIDPPPVGHVLPLSTVMIHSQIQGMISEVHFKEGQEVKQGDRLFRLTRVRRRRCWTRRGRRWNATRRSWHTQKSILPVSRNCSIKN